MLRKKSVATGPSGGDLDFSALVRIIRQAHEQSATVASRAVNTCLTLRNWAIGFYIHEYEQRGADRAAYGERLLDRLAETLRVQGVGDLAPRTLRQCRQFYEVYPTIRQTPSAKSLGRLIPSVIRQTRSAKSDVVTAVGLQTSLPAEKLLENLSFSHFAELIAIENPLKREFYEIECIRGNWSVRALKRQIDSLYFERSGLSLAKEKLSEMTHETAERSEPRLAIRDPYVFEFLGLKPCEITYESRLEDALLQNVQEFLLELGHGFCLEARQKSIVIGETRGFVDLVFYHRILKCHVLVELKVDEFRHEHIGQLNTYVAWYRKNMMSEGDNPPVGLLLCTGKDHALVEYALSSMNNRLFVSKYQLELPSKEALEKFLEEKRKEVTGDNQR